MRRTRVEPYTSYSDPEKWETREGAEPSLGDSELRSRTGGGHEHEGHEHEGHSTVTPEKWPSKPAETSCAAMAAKSSSVSSELFDKSISIEPEKHVFCESQPSRTSF